MNDLQQSFFFISQGGLSLDDYYAQFCGLCEELNICEPISSDIQTMPRQQERESMQVARFLSAVSSSYDSLSHQFWGSQELPSLSEVFSRLRHVSGPSHDHSALASIVYGSFGSSRGHGRGRDSGLRSLGHDSGLSGRDFGFNGRGSSLVGSGHVLGGGWLGPWYPIMYPFVGVQMIQWSIVMIIKLLLLRIQCHPLILLIFR